MASEQQQSFEDLLKEAPEAPKEGTVSLIGTLARSSEAGKFVLTLQNGGTLTLETSAVKGHTVLGTSVGNTIVRIDVEAGKVSALNPQPLPPREEGTLLKFPYADTFAALDHPITIPDIDHPFTFAVGSAGDLVVRSNWDACVGRLLPG